MVANDRPTGRGQACARKWVFDDESRARSASEPVSQPASEPHSHLNAAGPAPFPGSKRCSPFLAGAPYARELAGVANRLATKKLSLAPRELQQLAPLARRLSKRSHFLPTIRIPHLSMARAQAIAGPELRTSPWRAGGPHSLWRFYHRAYLRPGLVIVFDRASESDPIL